MFTPPGLTLTMPMVIGHSTSHVGGATAWSHDSSSDPASQTGIAANQAIYAPFIVTDTQTWTRGWWYNGSVATNAGNICVAVYDEAGTRLATTGAVAAAGNSVVQEAAFSVNVVLTPGVYYMGYSPSASGINAAFGYSGITTRGKLSGLYTQAVGVHPLPATWTASTWTSQIFPLFGIARTSFAI